MQTAKEWAIIVGVALEGVLVVVLMERWFFTSDTRWLEQHVDDLSIQALLFKETSLTLYAQTRLFFVHTKRFKQD
jgi:hypothetical protein